MYSASATFLTKIKSNTRKIEWSGTITTVGGSTYSFNLGGDFDNNIGAIVSGTISRSIASQELNIGTAYAGTLSMELILPGVSRYELYNGTISLNCSIDGALDVIPMGIFIISEAMQTADHITIKGYDNMVKFDAVEFIASLNNSIQLPHLWLEQMCMACGVTLGSTSAQIQAMPNGNRKTGFADSVADVKTWRDVLGYLAAYLGGFAYIGRDGALYIGQYKANSADTVPSSFRKSSNLSDFRTTFDGLYAVYKEEGVQEYVQNTNTGGLILDLGTNPFLQISNALNREAALQEIINKWDGVYYVPFQSEMPLVPVCDPGDVLTFTDNQADIYDYGAITQIVFTIGGTMSVTCCGDNPRLAAAEDRFTKSIAGLASEYSNGQEVGTKNFWLLHTDGTTPQTVGSTKTQVAEIVYIQKTDVQRMGFMFTCDGDLSDSAIIKVEITVDDVVEFTKEYSHRYLKGRRHIPVTWGSRITGKGTHEAKVYMTVTDQKLLWSELA